MVTYVNVTPNTRLRVVQPNRSVSNDYDDNEVTAYYKRRYIFICFLNDMCFIILSLQEIYKKINCSEVNSVAGKLVMPDC